jgi:antitoxin YefM
MLAVKSMDVRENFKEWCNRVIGGETLIVSRPKNENVVIVSEKEYNEMAKAKRNAEYLAMLDESFRQLEEGKTISFSMEELRAMESDDWKPTQKVLNWMKQQGQTNE